MTTDDDRDDDTTQLPRRRSGPTKDPRVWTWPATLTEWQDRHPATPPAPNPQEEMQDE